MNKVTEMVAARERLCKGEVTGVNTSNHPAPCHWWKMVAKVCNFGLSPLTDDGADCPYFTPRLGVVTDAEADTGPTAG